MNNQEVFNKVIEHARKQKKEAVEYSYDEDGENKTCKYRTEDGLKCFIGTLIPDDLYDPMIEGCSPFVEEHYTYDVNGTDKLNKILSQIGLNKEQRKFLQELQWIHDNYPVSQWESRLENIANCFDLEYTKPEGK